VRMEEGGGRRRESGGRKAQTKERRVEGGETGADVEPAVA